MTDRPRRRLPSRAPGRGPTAWWDPDAPDWPALIRRWEAHGWPQNGINNEICGNDDCGWEGELRVLGTPVAYAWTCPQCDTRYSSTSDDEVAAQIACAWSSGEDTHPDFCAACEW